MITYLNGRFVSESEAVVPVTDRGFLYGDGVFETLRVQHGEPVWWARHMARLERGLSLLRITLPRRSDELRHHAGELIQQNQLPDSTLRLSISRGSGRRGYSIQGADTPTVVMTLHPLVPPPSSLRLATATIRVPAHDPIALTKSANKLPHILARAEAEERGADEALLLNIAGDVAEASASNIFWIEGGAVCTPPLADGALAGVTREVVLEVCRQHQMPAGEITAPRSRLLGAEAVFLTNSTIGIVPASEIDAQRIAQSPLVPRLQEWLRDAERLS